MPMRNKEVTRDYYVEQLGFREVGSVEYPDYLMIRKDTVELHFFEFKELNPKENYGGVYIRVEGIDELYNSLLEKKVSIHPNGPLQDKPWGQREFALLDPDTNLLTFGETI
jgi:catechol 2,3-dioxygenase-like lactoylglutathione lyase family enzyme